MRVKVFYENWFAKLILFGDYTTIMLSASSLRS